MAKTKGLSDVFKVLHLATFSEIFDRSTTQDKVSDQQLKITFQHLDFVRKPLFIYRKRQPPPLCLVKVEIS